MKHDYTYLKGLIAAQGGLESVGREAGIDPATLQESLADKREFLASEIHSLGVALHLAPAKLETAFFTVKGESR